MRATLQDRVAALCDQAADLTRGHAVASAVARARARLDEPLRVALAGRVKAGKSTLLNALIGERLAPTDAGECTKIVTWYRLGTGYGVTAHHSDGAVRELRFSREDARLEVHLDGVAPSSIERLEVHWPSSRLAKLTLIDTPGLEAADDAAAARTTELLGVDVDSPASVDAVVYLMRHLHRSDAEFLEAFVDRSVPYPSPVNAIAVLSRADEIGAGRLDALESAATIADRYASDRRVTGLCASVIAVAGLIAETGVTLREDEAAAIAELARHPAEEQAAMLLSVDRFTDARVSTLPSAVRSRLLERLGLFGVRTCTAIAVGTPDINAAQLSRRLTELSGVERLVELLERHFTRRSEALKARSALTAIRAVARELERDDPARATRLEGALEAVESTAHELAELRLWHLVLTGAVDLDATERAELERLTGDGEPHERLGLTANAAAETLGDAAIAGATRWRDRGDHPMASRDVREVCEVVARSYEGVYQGLRNGAS